jgi:tetratricopeptide (TPR) repeat protein
MVRKILFVVAVLAALLASGCAKKGDQLTTTSQEALEAYRQGIEAADKLYLEEAAEHFGQAVALDPEFAVAYSRLSAALQNLGDESKALEYQMKALSLLKDETGKDRVTEKERLYIVLQDAYLHYDFDKALVAIGRWIDRYPKDHEARAFLGMEHMRMENSDEAIAEFKRALELNSDYVPAYNSLGYAYLAKGDFDKAMEYLNKYKKRVPDQANPYDSMGEIEQARGRYKEAIKLYQKAQQINPDLSFVLYHLGEVHRIQGQYSRAIQYFMEAAEKASGAEAESIARQYLAYTYLRRGDVKQALTEAGRAVELFPRDPLAHYNLGLVKVAMGDLEAARTDAQKVDEWLTKRRLRRYKMERYLFHLMGEIHLAEGEYDSALESHKQALNLAPNPLSRNFFLHALGNAYYRAGQMAEAIPTLQMALNQNPNDADCLHTMSLIFKEKGDTKEAKQWLNRFKEVLEQADEGVVWVEKAKGLQL